MKICRTKFSKKFRQQHKIGENDTLVAFLPGSRISEVDRLMPVFKNVSSMLISQKLNTRIVTVVALQSNILW